MEYEESNKYVQQKTNECIQSPFVRTAAKIGCHVVTRTNVPL